jgi:hypothetical protein
VFCYEWNSVFISAKHFALLDFFSVMLKRQPSATSRIYAIKRFVDDKHFAVLAEFDARLAFALRIVDTVWP